MSLPPSSTRPLGTSEEAVPASVPTPIRPRAQGPSTGLTMLAVLGAFVLAGGVGMQLGRVSLESNWSQPFEVVTPDRAAKASVSGADPTPGVGTKIIKPMPLARARVVLSELTKPDPATIATGAVGRDESDMALNVMVKNKGNCEITAISGVAYGFDAWNKPVPMNKSGEHYVSFTIDKLKIEAGKMGKASFPLHFPETASIAVGHIDQITCAGGSTWKRPASP
ncbi:MAG: hypothetical protein U0165_19220 [Polyangiaceae bacterium]